MIHADIRGMTIEQVATVVAEALGHILRDSESKFVADVTKAGVLTKDEAHAALNEHRTIVISELNPQFVKIFEELRSDMGGGRAKVSAKRLTSGAIFDPLETSTISGKA